MYESRMSEAFKDFGHDLKEARIALGMTRRQLTDKIGIDPRYLANIENSGFIPSLAYFYDLVTACNLPINKYFYPEMDEQESEARERIKLKISLCPENYLPIIEATVSGILSMDKTGDA